MIRHIAIENFKSIRELDLELNPINILSKCPNFKKWIEALVLKVDSNLY